MGTEKCVHVSCHPNTEELKTIGFRATNKKRHRNDNMVNDKNTQTEWWEAPERDSQEDITEEQKEKMVAGWSI